MWILFIQPIYFLVIILLWIPSPAISLSYFIQQLDWPLSLYFTCKGVPELKKQRVNFIEESSSIYYSTLMSGRFIEDRFLDVEIPASSMFKNKIYLELLQMVLKSSYNELGSLLFMKMSCHLFNNLDWVKHVYNRPLSRNTETVRAILDSIFRVGLCIRNIDPDLNCPDVCRNKPKFCKDVPHTTGVCSSYIEMSIQKSELKYSNDTKKMRDDVKNWMKNIPMSRRLPMELILNVSKSELLFDRIIELQKLSARKAYCECLSDYRYDKFIGGCVDMYEDTSCGGLNPCANHGQCIRRKEIDSSSLQSESFICLCTPAFRGKTCEIERDPCVEEGTCGKFTCARDPNDFHYGYSCLCPPGYRRKSSGEPICVPLPACGERETGDEISSTAYSSNSYFNQPCLNNGRCVQDLKDPTLYTCVCTPGYSGKNCEFAPTPALWSSWSSWSRCIWPEIREVCYKSAYQQQTRICKVNALNQKCVGQMRRIRYSRCDFTASQYYPMRSLTEHKQNRLINATALCDISGLNYIQPISEDELGESLLSIDSLDDWSSIGLEEAPYLHLPNTIGHYKFQSYNWPSAKDFLFITAWIYVIIIHIALIIIWICNIRKWRTKD